VATEPTEPESKKQDGSDQPGPAGWLGVVLLLAAVGWLGYRSYPAHHPLKHDPGFIDDVFANNLVLFAARLVLFSAALVLAVTAVYVMWSMGKWMGNRQFLHKFGPFEVQAVEDLSEELENWQQWWAEENSENTELRQQVEELRNLVEVLYGQLGALATEIQRSPGEENSREGEDA
jgi:hypothetical protein